MTNPIVWQAVYTEYGTGMDHIANVKGQLRRERRLELYPILPPDQVVGVFGVVDENGKEINSGWKVSGLRKDKRHGAVEKPEGFSKYGKSLLDSMFAGWNDESGIAG